MEQQQQHPVPVAGHAQQQQHTAAASFDPETSPVPGQQAWAILDLHGTMVRSSADISSPIVQDAKTLYGMLVESTPLVSKSQDDNGTGGGLKRMTINFAASSLRYVIARDDNHIYLVQTKGQ
jgi:hypothetical protein